jgi:C-terminal processing protease CtpA/Prc
MKYRIQNLMLGAAFAALAVACAPQVTFAEPPAQRQASAAEEAFFARVVQDVYESLPGRMKLVLRLSSTENAQKLMGKIIAERKGLIEKTLASLPNKGDAMVKSLSPRAQAALERLTAEERAATMPSIETIIAAMNSQATVIQLIATPPAKLLDALKEARSDAVYYRADEKFNHCNVMLDREAAEAYDEAGVRRLAAATRECPSGPGVKMADTITYVNHLLACTIQDPEYTRVMDADEYKEFREQVSGKAAAFGGGGIGLELPVDWTRTVPLTGDELAQWKEDKAVHEKAWAKPAVDECTGKPTTLPDAVKAMREEKKEFFARGPVKPIFTGLVGHVISTGPGKEADVRSGDIIKKIDDREVIGLDNDYVISKLLRGPLKTTVTLTILRDGKELPPKTLTRARIVPHSVYSVDLGSGIYSIVITNFEVENNAFRVLDEMKRLEPKAKGWIFDARNNPGGVLDEGIQAVQWLMHDGIIFSQRERVPGDPADPQYHQITWTRSGDKIYRTTVDDKSGKLITKEQLSFYEADPATGEKLREFKEQPFLLASGKPAVVLCNKMCASAAEIFTAGVSENCIGDVHCVDASGRPRQGRPQGAVFIGDPEGTYGKFIGQGIKPGPQDGEKGEVGVKETTFRYFTPNKEWLGDAWKTKIGLKPQIPVRQPKYAMPYTPSDAQLAFAKEYLLSGGKAKPPVQANGQ